MDKRQRIIDAARARFRHYGIAKTTMQEVATDAGVAVGTLYRYFEHKDALAAACADDFIADHRRQIDRAVSGGGTPDERLREYILARYRRCREVGTESRHAIELARAVLRLKPDRLREESDMMRGAIVAILKEGVGAGRFTCADPEGDAIVFLLSIAYFFPTAMAAPAEWPREDWLLLVVDWFLGVWSGRRSDRGAESVTIRP